MSLIITVEIREIYGKQTVYPACPKSLLFAGIARTKTLTPEVIADIQRLGYEVKVQPQKVNFTPGARV